MTLLSWNIRRLNGRKMKQEVVTLMCKFQLEIVGLLESQVRRKNYGKVIKSFEHDWKCVTNSVAWEVGDADSIWILWNPRLWIAR